jgi:hypothetical protein
LSQSRRMTCIAATVRGWRVCTPRVV